MGAVKIWNEMEVAAEARQNGITEFLTSSLTVDTSLSLPHLTPRVLLVIHTLLDLVFFSSLKLAVVFYSLCCVFTEICVRICSRSGQNWMILDSL